MIHLTKVILSVARTMAFEATLRMSKHYHGRYSQLWLTFTELDHTEQNIHVLCFYCDINVMTCSNLLWKLYRAMTWAANKVWQILRL